MNRNFGQHRAQKQVQTVSMEMGDDTLSTLSTVSSVAQTVAIAGALAVPGLVGAGLGYAVTKNKIGALIGLILPYAIVQEVIR